MSAISITLSSLSIESIDEGTEVPKLEKTNEDTKFPEFENTNDIGKQRKICRGKYLFLMFILIIGLSVSIAIAIEANKSPPKRKFNSTITLFYNMTFSLAELITSTSETSFCGDHLWISDGQCDDESNKIDCQYDGGDCCLPNSTLTFCMKCICHLTGHRHDQISTERALVVIGGRIIDSPAEDFSSTEVIFDSKDFTNQFFPSYPHDRVGTCGGVVDSLIIVCGGVEENGFGYTDLILNTISGECNYFSPLDNKWLPIHNMDRPRMHAASIVVNGKLWITGGFEVNYLNGWFHHESTSEFVDPKHPNTVLKGPDMPYDCIALHCLTLLRSTERQPVF